MKIRFSSCPRCFMLFLLFRTLILSSLLDSYVCFSPPARLTKAVFFSGLHLETFSKNNDEHAPLSEASRLQMAVKVPTNVKETVSSMRKSIQAALQSKNSRMMVELPRGANFGMETDEDGVNSYDGGVEKSDRELARLLVEMFQPLGESLVCTFPSDQQVKKAKSAWGNSYEGTIKTLTPKKAKGGRRKGGFAAKLEAELAEGPSGFADVVLPKGTEVVIAVAPSQKDMVALEKLANEVGLGCLILIANGRFWEKKDIFSSDEQEDFFDQAFETVFEVKVIPDPEGDGLIQYKSYGEDWVIAKKQNFGAPKILLSSENPFSEEQIQEALDISAQTPEGILDNLTGMFKKK